MSTPTTNMAMGKAVDADNAKTYLETTLGAALDTLDSHDHSTNAKGLAVTRGINFVIASGGLQVTAGNVGIGTGVQANAGLYVSGSILSGSVTQYGVNTSATASSGATTETSGFASQPATAAAAFTCATVAGFHAINPIKGAGSTITNAYGLLIDDITVGATINAGIQSQGDILPSSTATTSMVKGFIYIPTASGTPTGAPNNRASGTWSPLYYDSSAHKIWVYDNAAAGWKGVAVI